jgi:hypothetical protein
MHRLLCGAKDVVVNWVNVIDVMLCSQRENRALIGLILKGATGHDAAEIKPFHCATQRPAAELRWLQIGRRRCVGTRRCTAS